MAHLILLMMILRLKEGKGPDTGIQLVTQLLFSQQILIKVLLGVLCEAGCWRYSSEQQRHGVGPHGTFDLSGENRNRQIPTLKVMI